MQSLAGLPGYLDNDPKIWIQGRANPGKAHIMHILILERIMLHNYIQGEKMKRITLSMKMKMIMMLSVVMILSSVLPLTAQSSRPALRIKGYGYFQPLLLTKLGVEVKITGLIAETKMTMTFYNTNCTVLEGELIFPLPQGATVSGYALDINGVLVDGVVVEKEKGRVVFEKIVRQGIDPGLVEMVKGNNFRTRVYPILAGNSRTISVRYLSELDYRDKQALFHLPLNFGEKVDDFSIRVEVVKPGTKPVIKEKAFAGFEFSRWQEAYVAETRLKDFLLDRDLTIALPQVDMQKVYVEKGPDGDCYFSVLDLNPPAEDIVRPGKKAPRHITILWDASGSRSKSNHEKELQLIEAFFKGVAPPAGRKKITVDLIFFRNRRSAPRRFIIKNGNCSKLIAAIKDAVYDGGTQMSAISPRRREKVPDFYMLFSDGMSNFGKEKSGGFKAPLYVFSTSSSVNHTFLDCLARQTGGLYFNMNRMDEETILKNIACSTPRFIPVEAAKGVISETYPAAMQPLSGPFILTGKLTAPQGTITLNYGIDGEILKKVSFMVNRTDAVAGNLLRTFWAQKKTEELRIFAKENKEELIETGKQYGLVTPYTSLIVLESLNQYIEHEIKPPAMLPEMRKEYEKVMTKRKEQEKLHKKTKFLSDSKIERIVSQWEKRVAWWGKRFFLTGKERLPVARNPWKILNLVPGMMVDRDDIGGWQPAHQSAFYGLGADDDDTTWHVDGANITDPSLIGAAPSYLNFNSYYENVAAGDRQIRDGLIAWAPHSPYLEKMAKVSIKAAFAVYLEQKKIYSGTPGFFLDCSDYFFAHKQKDLGLQVLSNIAEMELENAAMLRILGYRLAQSGFLGLSSEVFEKVLELRPEEPQSFRDLALVSARSGKYKKAVDLLYYVVTNSWDNRFQNIEVIALMEINQIIARAKRNGKKIKDIAAAVDPRLLKLLDVDMRIVLTWDEDLTDIDLRVIEPTGEEAYFGNKHTRIGGLVSNDFTEGYGPEEYLLKKAIPGRYKIMAEYFGSDAPEILGPLTLQVDIFFNYGRKDEKRKSVTLRLKEEKETITIEEIEFSK